MERITSFSSATFGYICPVSSYAGYLTAKREWYEGILSSLVSVFFPGEGDIILIYTSILSADVLKSITNFIQISLFTRLGSAVVSKPRLAALRVDNIPQPQVADLLDLLYPGSELDVFLVPQSLRQADQDRLLPVPPRAHHEWKAELGLVPVGESIDRDEDRRVQGRRHGFSPVGATFPIYIVHCVLAEFQWGQ